MPKRYLYALIPLGFIALVAVMVVGGEVEQETTPGIVGEEVQGEG